MNERLWPCVCAFVAIGAAGTIGGCAGAALGGGTASRQASDSPGPASGPASGRAVQARRCTSPAKSAIVWQQADSVPATLSGRVVALDGTPMRSASVLLEPGAGGVVTGPDGSFSFPMPAPGEYRLRVRSIGRADLRDSVFLTGSTGLTFLVVLAQPEWGLRVC